MVKEWNGAHYPLGGSNIPPTIN